jgi:hypothetical protein
MESLGLGELRIKSQQAYIVEYMKYDKKQLIELLKIREKEKLLSLPDDLFDEIVNKFLTLDDKINLSISCKNTHLRINFIQNERDLIKVGVNKYFNDLYDKAKSILIINDELINIHKKFKFLAKFVDNNTNYNDDYKSKFRKIFLIFYHLETKIDDEGKSIEIRIMQLEILVLLKQMLYNQPILVLKILYEIDMAINLDCIIDEQLFKLINFKKILKNMKVINKNPIQELCLLCDKIHSLAEFDIHD